MRLEGRLEDFSLLDVVQTALRYPGRVRLLVADDDHEGGLETAGGCICEARWDQATGEDAVFLLLTQKKGFFSLDGSCPDAEAGTGLALSWPDLLHRAFQRALHGSVDDDSDGPGLSEDQREVLARDLWILLQSLESDVARLESRSTVVEFLSLQCEMLNMTVSMAPEGGDPELFELSSILPKRGWRGSGASLVQLKGALVDVQMLLQLYDAAAFDGNHRSREAGNTARMVAAALDDLLSALTDLVESNEETRPLQDRKRSFVRNMVSAIDARKF